MDRHPCGTAEGIHGRAGKRIGAPQCQRFHPICCIGNGGIRRTQGLKNMIPLSNSFASFELRWMRNSNRSSINGSAINFGAEGMFVDLVCLGGHGPCSFPPMPLAITNFSI